MKRITGAQYDTRETLREKNNRKLAYRAAVEGIVLLENNGVLPLSTGNIALYGAGARHTVKGGAGSGEVNERYSATIYDGLKEKGFNILTDRCLRKYDVKLEEAKKAYEKDVKENHTIIDVWGLVFTMPVADEITKEDLVECDTAMYAVARQAGEGRDRRLEAGFKLSQEEVNSLKLLRQHYQKVILVINSGSSVDISDVDDCKPDAVIFFCQEGLEGGRALASLLTGEENFSGKLSDTWVYRYQDIPFGNEFSYMNGDTAREYYKEGIYVGYRYYDTFNVPVRYHFGYGLSYTDFEMTVRAVTLQGKAVEMEVLVRNTDRAAGKETVQVYVSAPARKLDKEYQRLVAFAKTDKLQPGETETVKLSFDMEYCASYDQQENCFILEKGNYIIRVGNSSDNTSIAAVINNKETIVISRHGDLLKCNEEFKELHAPQRKEIIPEGIEVLDLDESCFKTVTHQYPGMKAVDDDRVKEIIRKLSREEKIKLVMGESNDDRGLSTRYIYTPGTVARTTEALMDKGVINTNLADGPAGLRLLKESALDKDGNIKYLKDNFQVAAMELFLEARPLEDTDTVLYQYPTAWPAATALAQSFNTDLIEEIGRITSQEMVEFNVTFWLAPGMNIHKNPLCGRNFEYYSEDPVLSGKIASALLKGVGSIPGNYITIKHFACNNAEDNRSFTDSIVKQRALREIYLRGFEIAVKEGKATGLMTSYNKINGVYAPDNYDLAVRILRNEWGFEGVVMTDWTSTLEGQGSNVKAVKAGHIIMPGGSYYRDEVRKGLEEGTLSEEELDMTISYLLKAILHSNVASRYRAEELI